MHAQEIATEVMMSGQCHCGIIRLEFFTTKKQHQLIPRACDCSFCCKHGAAYISDPNGRLRIYINDATALQRYRQGSQSAEFLLCRVCGVLLVVTYDEQPYEKPSDKKPSSLYGAVNVRCLELHEQLPAAIAVSPQQLETNNKRERWRNLWTANVELVLTQTT